MIVIPSVVSSALRRLTVKVASLSRRATALRAGDPSSSASLDHIKIRRRDIVGSIKPLKKATDSTTTYSDASVTPRTFLMRALARRSELTPLALFLQSCCPLVPLFVSLQSVLQPSPPPRVHVSTNRSPRLAPTPADPLEWLQCRSQLAQPSHNTAMLLSGVRSAAMHCLNRCASQVRPPSHPFRRSDETDARKPPCSTSRRIRYRKWQIQPFPPAYEHWYHRPRESGNDR